MVPKHGDFISLGEISTHLCNDDVSFYRYKDNRTVIAVYYGLRCFIIRPRAVIKVEKHHGNIVLKTVDRLGYVPAGGRWWGIPFGEGLEQIDMQKARWLWEIASTNRFFINSGS